MFQRDFIFEFAAAHVGNTAFERQPRLIVDNAHADGALFAVSLDNVPDSFIYGNPINPNAARK